MRGRCAAVRSSMSSFPSHRPLDHRPLAGCEMKGQAHDFERQQQVGKNDGCVDPRGLGGGNRDFGRDRRLLANLDERILLAQGAVFGHVAPSLAHEPDRRLVDRLRPASLHEAGFGGRHKPLNVAFSAGSGRVRNGETAGAAARQPGNRLGACPGSAGILLNSIVLNILP